MTPGFAQRCPRPCPPVSVWATGQHDSHTQLAQGSYTMETAQDCSRIPPAIAAHAIAAYTRPGDTVLDPDCGAGTVLVEALRAGRHAVGVTDQRWWPIARANVNAAKYDGAQPDGMVLDGPLEAATGRLTGLAGRLDLALTAWRQPHHRRPRTEAPDRSHPDTRGTSSARLRTLLAQCQLLLRPGGHVIVIVPRRRCRGYLLDLPGDVWQAGRAAGLMPVERCIALTAELRGSRLVVRASLTQRRSAARHERATGQPIMLPAHHDVLIFQAGQQATAVARRSRPDPGIIRPSRGESAALPQGLAA